MAKRVSKKVVAAVTTDDFNTALSAYAKNDAGLAEIRAQMDKKITAIREKHAQSIEDMEEANRKHLEVIETYCTENRDVLFSKKRSMETAHGVVGFRTGTPKLKPVKGFTWASILLLVEAKLPNYIRTKKEVDKETILANRDNAEVKTLLPDLGIAVDQDENFFVELKKEEELAV